MPNNSILILSDDRLSMSLFNILIAKNDGGSTITQFPVAAIVVPKRVNFAVIKIKMPNSIHFYF